jgi:hypothetical protein
VLAISPVNWSKKLLDDILEGLTLKLPINNGKIFQNDTVLKGGSVQVVHSVGPQRVKELGRALWFLDAVAAQRALLDH